jgi:hypothetical protein
MEIFLVFVLMIAVTFIALKIRTYQYDKKLYVYKGEVSTYKGRLFYLLYPASVVSMMNNSEFDFSAINECLVLEDTKDFNIIVCHRKSFNELFEQYKK